MLEDVTIDEPRDALALLAGHQIDFFTGNSRMLRDRIARAMPAWSEGMAGYHATLAMQAFGFEEMGDYAARRSARPAGDRARAARRLGAACGRPCHGDAVPPARRHRLDARTIPSDWTGDSFLQVHNWWHLALFHYELGEIDEALALFDAPIYGKHSTLALNMLDASAMLWRLHLSGVDVGDRWAALAANWAPKAEDGNYAFNDVHAMMAFVGAGLDEPARDAARGAASRRWRAAATMPASPAMSAIRSRSRSRPSARATMPRRSTLLRPVRSIAYRFGGSHAQRDVIDLTLIEAAFRAGDDGAGERTVGGTRGGAAGQPAVAALHAPGDRTRRQRQPSNQHQSDIIFAKHEKNLV